MRLRWSCTSALQPPFVSHAASSSSTPVQRSFLLRQLRILGHSAANIVQGIAISPLNQLRDFSASPAIRKSFGNVDYKHVVERRRSTPLSASHGDFCASASFHSEFAQAAFEASLFVSSNLPYAAFCAAGIYPCSSRCGKLAA